MSPLASCSCAKNYETKEEVAIKKIGNAFDNRIDAKRTLREIKLLCHMDHENVYTQSYIDYHLLLPQTFCILYPLTHDYVSQYFADCQD